VSAIIRPARPANIELASVRFRRILPVRPRACFSLGTTLRLLSSKASAERRRAERGGRSPLRRRFSEQASSTPPGDKTVSRQMYSAREGPGVESLLLQRGVCSELTFGGPAHHPDQAVACACSVAVGVA
jgi:hypothetical protein